MTEPQLIVPTADEILELWFGQELDSAKALAERTKLWFAADPQFDGLLRERFAALPAQALQGELSSWGQSARSILALVLVLDQFPRNLYRGSEQAFAFDPVALKVASVALDAGLDQELAPVESLFLYLPFEHAEDLEAQARAVELIAAQVERAPQGLKSAFEEFLSFAVRHQKVIARFGRFPGRNRVLGRDSTREELAFLEEGGAGF